MISYYDCHRDWRDEYILRDSPPVVPALTNFAPAGDNSGRLQNSPLYATYYTIYAEMIIDFGSERRENIIHDSRALIDASFRIVDMQHKLMKLPLFHSHSEPAQLVRQQLRAR
jgi:hypothetical protein